VETGAVELDIVTSDWLSQEKKTAEIDDPTRYIVVAERGLHPAWWNIDQIAYPELCRSRFACAKKSADAGCFTCAAQWEKCPQSVACGIDWHDIDRFWTDASMRSSYARHLGGNNLGFADGHAAWWPADAMIAAANKQPQELEGIGPQALPYW
jgi:prepilin-type processing-associated H-X9-DG protein